MPFNLDMQPEPTQLEALEQALWEHGALAITLLDAADQPLLEPGPGELPLWDRITVRALLADDCDAAAVLDDLRARRLIEAGPDRAPKPLPERDWERAWLDQFKPMRFGDSIWICPSNCQPEPDWPVVVRLDPGLAFGTGTHPTTAMCLEWLDARDCAGRALIDYGCGSGVLAVAGALKGARPVIAVDHDPQALTATADNARRNGVETVIRTALPETMDDTAADLLLANILAGPLVELAACLAERLKPGGELVLSGLLIEQADAVEAAYRAQGLRPVDRRQREGWCALALERA
ncbi:MAG: 50S ribosomal protein L11 methyltransferase [Wenzhouxiangellaceae bacterium]|nr:50S ribosomal protein L11 methyltransferase [Wenzhouxiangellaceae bacterium]